MIRLYNTLTHAKEVFTPQERGVVSMYHCGPTAYDFVHIGNLRSFVLADTVRRVMEYNGYEVRQVMNITDVDDKTIRRASDEGKTLAELTAYYEAAFLADSDALGIKRPAVMPRATEHIESIVFLVEKLLQNNAAYRAEDGSVYYDISSSKNYGALAGLEKQTLKAGARVAADEYAKDDVRDFVLWKAWVPEDGDVFWETSLGKGRPGWHSECSAMSMKYLGTSFDIHTGGEDLIFPHHTNEIAQSESAGSMPFVRYWLHNAFITINGKKMAKSEGNILTLRDITDRGVSPLAYRYWLLQAHYRQPVNVTWAALDAADNALRKLYDHYETLCEDTKNNAAPDKYDTMLFQSAINDDLNTPQAIAALWDTLRDTGASASVKKARILDADRVLGLGFEEYSILPIPDEILERVKEREAMRKNKDWKGADAVRKELEKEGYNIIDTDNGPRIRRPKR